MDSSEISQDINRNVMDALWYLQSRGSDCFIEREKIALQVGRQMRGTTTKNVINKYINDSLNNLTNAGVLAQTGCFAYAMRHTLTNTLRYGGVKDAPVQPTNHVMDFKPGNRHLDPQNPIPSIITKDLISGDKLTKARKRIRSNNKRLHVKKGIPKPQPPVKLAEASKNVTATRRKRKEYLTSKPDTVAAFSKAYIKLMDEQTAKREAATQQNSWSTSNQGSHSMLTTSNNIEEYQQLIPPLAGITDYTLFGISSTELNMLQPNTDNASIIGLCGSRMLNGYEKRWAPCWERLAGVEANLSVEPLEKAVQDRYDWLTLSINRSFRN